MEASQEAGDFPLSAEGVGELEGEIYIWKCVHSTDITLSGTRIRNSPRGQGQEDALA